MYRPGDLRYLNRLSDRSPYFDGAANGPLAVSHWATYRVTFDFLACWLCFRAGVKVFDLHRSRFHCTSRALRHCTQSLPIVKWTAALLSCLITVKAFLKPSPGCLLRHWAQYAWYTTASIHFQLVSSQNEGFLFLRRTSYGGNVMRCDMYRGTGTWCICDLLVLL